MNAPFATRLTHEEVEKVRHRPGRSMLLFITDRCPVGCLHCSVDSRPNSPTIRDFDLFGEILDWLCAQAGVETVGISGGEPFVERRGLEIATRRLHEAGKRLVIFTSGIWAGEADAPRWITDVLARTDCVYLSTDAFHSSQVPNAHFVNAARSIRAAGAWLVVQVLEHGDAPATAEAGLRQAFGDDWRAAAQINLIKPLLNGRGASQFSRTASLEGRDFGPCGLVASPMIRYDGVVTGCCNEAVIMGFGPARLRRRARSRAEIDGAVEAFRADPFLRALHGAGPGALTLDDRFADLGQRAFSSICDLCWEIADRLPVEPDPDPLLEAVAAMASRS